MIVIVDIDDTVAYAAMQRGPFDYELVSGDVPLPEVVRTLQMLRSAGARLDFWTGREEWCRGDTEDWLHTHVGDFGTLLMRPNGNRDGGVTLKRAWLKEYLEAFPAELLIVIEDQPKIATALRLDGVTVLCCGNSDFVA